LALAVGIAAFTAVLAIDLGFRREIAGSSLGGFITTQTRTVDYLSAALAVALGVASTADVLYLNLRERAPEIAALAATGWQRQHLIRVALYEGASVGIVGSLAGAALGLTVAAAVGAGGLAMLLAALCAIGGGVVLTIAATRVVANVLTRLPLAAALTEE
jgi:ABC-type lipoprotein release transport system permease subunit